MSWLLKDCRECKGKGWSETEVAGELLPCSRCFTSGKVLREGAKDRYLLGVASKLCIMGLEAKDISFDRIEELWEQGADFNTAVRHFVLENQPTKPDNDGVLAVNFRWARIMATDGSDPKETQ